MSYKKYQQTNYFFTNILKLENIIKGALLHKDFKERAFLSCLNLSDNLGVRSAELRKLI